MNQRPETVKNGTKEQRVTIGIIGAGPGGYIAALSAARRGARVTLVERERVGGSCLRRGCIPTKTLYRSRQVMECLRNSAMFGVHAGEADFDLAEILKRKNMIVNMLTDGTDCLLRAGNIELVRGHASFLDGRRLLIRERTGGERILETDFYIVATGAVHGEVPFPVEGDPAVAAAEEFFDMDRIPDKLVIVGGGAVGAEMAAICCSFGSKVTIVEQAPSLLPGVDVEITEYLRREMEKRGVRVLLSSRVKRVKGGPARARVQIEGADGSEMEMAADLVLLAMGRRARTEGLNLDCTGARMKDGFLEVDDGLETAAPGIYGIGDVCGGPMLAHAASRQGELLAERLMRKGKKAGGTLKIDSRLVPACIFSLAEVASVGYSEKEAVLSGRPVSVGRFPFSANGKALADGANGFVKVVIDGKTREILGIHAVGQDASSLIGEASLIVTHRMKVEDVTEVIHPHPTLSETLREACLSAVGMAFHVANLSGMSYRARVETE